MKKTFFLMLLVTALVSCTNKPKTHETQNQETMKPIELTKAEFINQVFDYESNPTEWKYEGTKPAIVDFYATWCGPCKRLAPVLEEIAQEYAEQIVVYKINTESETELAEAFGIRSIPTLLFIPMNGQPQMAQGAMSKADLKQAIDELLLNNNK